MIHLQHAAFVYQAPDGEVEALRDVSFDVVEGEFCSIVGPSGCGKSTLLSALAVGFSEYFGNVNYQKAIDKVLSYYSVKDNWDGEYHLVLTVDNVNKQFVFKEVFNL